MYPSYTHTHTANVQKKLFFFLFIVHLSRSQKLVSFYLSHGTEDVKTDLLILTGCLIFKWNSVPKLAVIWCALHQSTSQLELRKIFLSCYILCSMIQIYLIVADVYLFCQDFFPHDVGRLIENRLFNLLQTIDIILKICRWPTPYFPVHAHTSGSCFVHINLHSVYI